MVRGSYTWIDYRRRWRRTFQALIFSWLMSHVLEHFEMLAFDSNLQTKIRDKCHKRAVNSQIQTVGVQIKRIKRKHFSKKENRSECRQ